MILKNHSLSHVRLFSGNRPFAMPFSGYRYFNELWVSSRHWSCSWLHRIENNRFIGRHMVSSCHWRGNT